MPDNSLTINRDHLTPEGRSRNMAKIGPKDTKPEKIVRSLLHRAGFRFRKNVQNLPGKPDIVLPKYETVIFVHGCFWHRHDCKRGQSIPSNRREFWKEKFNRTIERDEENRINLEEAGWKVIVVWECDLKNQSTLKASLMQMLLKSTIAEH